MMMQSEAHSHLSVPWIISERTPFLREKKPILFSGCMICKQECSVAMRAHKYCVTGNKIRMNSHSTTMESKITTIKHLHKMYSFYTFFDRDQVASDTGRKQIPVGFPVESLVCSNMQIKLAFAVQAPALATHQPPINRILGPNFCICIESNGTKSANAATTKEPRPTLRGLLASRQPTREVTCRPKFFFPVAMRPGSTYIKP